MSNTIFSMSAQELRLLPIMIELAEEAAKDEEAIKNRYSSGFGIGVKEIHVYHTDAFGEYEGNGTLSVDGYFTYRDNWWGGRVYKFKVDADSIFNMLRSAYLRKNNLSFLDPQEFVCDIEHIDTYFRDFVKKIKEGTA